jgi:hypothetical protein
MKEEFTPSTESEKTDQQAQMASEESVKFKPDGLEYDGSVIYSSEKEAINKVRQEESENIDLNKSANKEDKTYSEEKINEIISQNKELNERLSQYEKFIDNFALLDVAGKAKSLNDKPETELDSKLNEYYNRAKNDAIKETLETIHQEALRDRKIEEVKTNNPDIIADPAREQIVCNLAASYIHQGTDFNTALDRAIEDLRKLISPVSSKKDQENQLAHNIPAGEPYKQTYSRLNPFIEGASPSIPEKQFRSSELIEMQINRPDEYKRLQPVIMRAYREGRVIFD